MKCSMLTEWEIDILHCLVLLYCCLYLNNKILSGILLIIASVSRIGFLFRYYFKASSGFGKRWDNFSSQMKILKKIF